MAETECVYCAVRTECLSIMQADKDERAEVLTFYKQWCVRNWGALVTEVRSLSLQTADHFRGGYIDVSLCARQTSDRVVNEEPLQIVESVNSWPWATTLYPSGRAA
jgi:hypothetical protein